MKIFTAAQMKQWDQATIASEPITSADLMERAAKRCLQWILAGEYSESSFRIYCGRGNNGGDGLALARMLLNHDLDVIVYLVGEEVTPETSGSSDYAINLQRLTDLKGVDIRLLKQPNDFDAPASKDILIDALFGFGLNRAPEGLLKSVIEKINASGNKIFSIDLPSGLFADVSSNGNTIVKADHTLSFQTPKLAFAMAENAEYVGELSILDIGLDEKFYAKNEATFQWVARERIARIYRPRSASAHKGTYGHALLIAGSYGKMGAAVLAAKACLHTGAGLLTCHLPKTGYEIMQVALPEAMVVTDFNSSYITSIDQPLETYKAIGIGPGLGKASETKQLLQGLMMGFNKPMVIDADALNMIGDDEQLQQAIPHGSVITPHPKEFERLFGKTGNEFERVQLALKKSSELNIIIILKGHHTLIATPDGKGSFNTTGNAGMAKGGTGDTLMGMILALLAQGYEPAGAAVLGVWLHGTAGDIAAEQSSMEAMLATDLINSIGAAYRQIGN